MLGLKMEVTVDGEDHVVDITPRVVVNFERNFKCGLTKAFGPDQRMEYLYWLAWEGLKTAGVTVKPFEQFLGQVDKVNLVSGKDDAQET